MKPVTFRHEAMATFFEITVADHTEEYARQAANAAWRELDRLEGELSRYVESSDISRANRLACGQTIQIGDDAFECLVLAAEMATMTERAFDVAYASVRASGLTADTPAFTLDPAAHALTSQVNGLHLDLGAIGKGYALDHMAGVLDIWGITAACLNSGGSTVLALAPPKGRAGWTTRLGDGANNRLVPLAQMAISGSGTAVKGAHLIDPRSGSSAKRSQHAWALAPTASVADALSTAFFIWDEDDIEAFCATQSAIGGARANTTEKVTLFGALRSQIADQKNPL